MKKHLFKQISIIGLGLIGSSLALSIKKNKLAVLINEFETSSLKTYMLIYLINHVETSRVR